MRLHPLATEPMTCGVAALAVAAALALVACRAPEPPKAGGQAPPAGAPAPMPAVGTPGTAAPPTVASDALPPGPVPPPATPGPPRLRVVGTEPFWGIRIDGDRLQFTTAEDPAGTSLAASPSPRADGIAYEGGQGGAAFALRLVRTPCSDGMSDRAYAYAATFRYRGRDYRGCADDAATF